MSEYIYGSMGDPLANALCEIYLPRAEIVRCRDCKFCHKNYCEKRTSPTVSPSEIYWIPVEPDGFCKWGERKEVCE